MEGESPYPLFTMVIPFAYTKGEGFWLSLVCGGLIYGLGGVGQTLVGESLSSILCNLNTITPGCDYGNKNRRIWRRTVMVYDEL